MDDAVLVQVHQGVDGLPHVVGSLPLAEEPLLTQDVEK